MSEPRYSLDDFNTIPTPDQIMMGDDGTGHCSGCGIPLDRFDEDCTVCMIALAVVNGEIPE